MRPDLRSGLSASDRERPLAIGVNGPLMARQPRSASLGVLARMPVAQLDPVHETGARLFKRDCSCWKSGLRSARFTNAHCRRPSAPPRKMAADPVQHSDQSVPVRMSAFLRHISIMHLLSLGYEPYDTRLSRPGRSPVAVLTLVNRYRASTPNLGVFRVAPHPAASRAQIRAQIWLLTSDIAVRVTASVSGLLRGSPNVRQARPRCLRCCPGVTITTPGRPPHRAREGHGQHLQIHSLGSDSDDTDADHTGLVSALRAVEPLVTIDHVNALMVSRASLVQCPPPLPPAVSAFGAVGTFTAPEG